MTQLARGALQTHYRGWGGGVLCFRSVLDFQDYDWLLFRDTCHLIYWTSAALSLLCSSVCFTTCIYDAVSFLPPPHPLAASVLRLPLASLPLLMRPFSASCRPVLWWERVPSRSATRLKAGGLQWGRWERGWVWGWQAGRAGLQWGRGWWWWGGRRSRWARSAAVRGGTRRCVSPASSLPPSHLHHLHICVDSHWEAHRTLSLVSEERKKKKDPETEPSPEPWSHWDQHQNNFWDCLRVLLRERDQNLTQECLWGSVRVQLLLSISCLCLILAVPPVCAHQASDSHLPPPLDKYSSPTVLSVRLCRPWHVEMHALVV